MSPAIVKESIRQEKGVKTMYDNGVQHIPRKYILPEEQRPCLKYVGPEMNLPIIDFAELRGPNRAGVLKSLAHACENYGFFQLVNHCIPEDVLIGMVDASKRFFDLPLSEREKYMSSDMKSPVRYGTSFNQTNDGVFCWRDFLKLVSHPLPEVIPHWPSNPTDFRHCGVSYAQHTRLLFSLLADAILESLGLLQDSDEEEEDMEELSELLQDLSNGSQLMVLNCYPPCPEPHLTLGMPPHSDYGFLTLLLQDDVKGLQIQQGEKWVTVKPVTGSFVVNVGDHLEIFSNGRYKSVLHRVIVNSSEPRISVASLHSLPFTSTVKPASRLVTAANPRRYKDTDFVTFLRYLSSCDSKNKNFIESRKIIQKN